ncbi:TPA: hypothetical protein ACJ2ST_001728 [Yersinia enterocolitica]
MVIDHIQEKIIGSDFFKVWVMSLHCVIPLGEFKGTAGTVFCNATGSVTCLADPVYYYQ